MLTQLTPIPNVIKQIKILLRQIGSRIQILIIAKKQLIAKKLILTKNINHRTPLQTIDPRHNKQKYR